VGDESWATFLISIVRLSLSQNLGTENVQMHFLTSKFISLRTFATNRCLKSTGIYRKTFANKATEF